MARPTAPGFHVAARDQKADGRLHACLSCVVQCRHGHFRRLYLPYHQEHAKVAFVVSSAASTSCRRPERAWSPAGVALCFVRSRTRQHASPSPERENEEAPGVTEFTGAHQGRGNLVAAHPRRGGMRTTDEGWVREKVVGGRYLFFFRGEIPPKKKPPTSLKFPSPTFAPIIPHRTPR